MALGVGAMASCKVEYGSPHADYEAKGRVTDEEGNPVKGIKVEFVETYGTDSLGNAEYYPLSDEYVLTGDDGSFGIKSTLYTAGTDSITVGFIDVDGESNGGEFATKMVKEPLVRIKDGKDWNEGTFAVPDEMEVTLERVEKAE